MEIGDGGPQESFLSLLLKKLAYVQKVEAETGKSTKPLQEEVWRQIHQVMGSPIDGKGVTKSGGDD